MQDKITKLQNHISYKGSSASLVHAARTECTLNNYVFKEDKDLGLKCIAADVLVIFISF